MQRGSWLRYVWWAVIVVVVVGAATGYQFYQMRRATEGAGEGFHKTAEMMEKLRLSEKQ